MERIKGLFRKACILSSWPTFLIAIPSFALVAYALASRHPSQGLRIASYALSAYGLTVLTTWTIRFILALRRDKGSIPLIRWANENPVASCLIADRAHRARVALLLGMIVNLAYVGVKLAMGVIFHSLWFAFGAVYYLVLMAMRGFLLYCMVRHQAERDRRGELRVSRLCGVLLLILNQVLAFIVTMAVCLNRGYEYPGYLIYAMAGYSFYAIISAAIHLTRQVKAGDPLYSALHVVSLTSAMVSIFSLETAMLTQFGQGEDPAFRQIMTGSTGAVICLLVLGMAVAMIVRATRELRAIQNTGKEMTST